MGYGCAHDRFVRVLAMGVVKPANDDEEFWRQMEEREDMRHLLSNVEGGSHDGDRSL